MIEPSGGCKVLSLAVGAIFDSLGWAYAREGEKGLPFAQAFHVLGVAINLQGMPKGFFIIANKQARVEKLVQMLNKISSQGTINYSEASEQGLLNFAVGFFSGKLFKHLVSAFHPYVGDRSVSSSGSLRALCQYATTMITSLYATRSQIIVDPYSFSLMGAVLQRGLSSWMELANKLFRCWRRRI